MSKFIKLIFTVSLAVVSVMGVAQAKTLRIGLLAKSLGIGYFEAANRGALQAAEEIGDIEVIYTGPTKTTAEGQIEVINSLIAQGVDVIAVAANDPDALVPALKKAMQRGIKVISWDSAVAPEGRIIDVAPISTELMAAAGWEIIEHHLPNGKGNYAVVSATTTSTNQNVWLAEMKRTQDKHPGVNLLTTVYGDDLADKSYREAQGLLASYPDLDVIFSPTSVGVLATAQAVMDAKDSKVKVAGFGLPSEMLGAFRAGVSTQGALWNPVDLGYSVVYISKALVDGTASGEKGSKIEAGRMGTLTVLDQGLVVMAPPTVYDTVSIETLAKEF